MTQNFAWPNGKRMAVLVSVLLESWSDGKSPHYFTRTTPLKPGATDYAGIQWSQYGGEEGIWRIVRTLDECHMCGSVFANARAAELYPDAFKQIVRSGHAVEGHGYAQDQYFLEMTPEQQRTTIRKVLDILEKASGSRPEGWATPVDGWNEHTFDLLVQEGFAYLSVDFRGSTGYGRAYRHANRDEWGHADVHDVIDAARWAAAQAWSNGRLAMYGGSYGGYLTLCALVEEPSMWAAGVDLFGDSEIAESYRHGDRVGRIDLERMMGTPDDPSKVELYRRGSPLYRAERIEAPLLLLHGRKDRRVVPLMTEKMIEALEIEGKYHEVHWYADEGHGFDRRENRRDAFGRILAWLKRHLAGETPQPVA